ncbi:hypothetical protein RHMOL_Rhmol11G0263900 [Rhododendron molle]|uniref:Uncharacterized protein n=1 Tax=Rhododendron molle TaxID=49168 RepID=A0ACC0LXI6_RHOML|nr:hypothetical protein RHMOL_Rhmol11G0263900 [Rhododendron molle]
MDVIQLLKDTNTANHPLGTILLDWSTWCWNFEAVSIKHIYHEANRCADILVNDAPVLVEEIPYLPGRLFLIVLLLFCHADLIGMGYPRIVST